MKSNKTHHRGIARIALLVLLAFSLSSCSLSSCSLYKLKHINNYEDFAEVANTIWATLYFKIMKPQTPYDRVIYQDTLWRKKKGPVTINGSLFILPGVTLTIEPGVVIQMGKDAVFRCQGVLTARGTKDDPILFTRQQEGEYWSAIEFNNCIKKAGTGEARVTLENCIIEYGQGVVVNSSTADVTACVFREHISTALKFEYASGNIMGNEFYNNSTERQCETGNGGGINVYTNKNVRIENNDIHDNISHGGRDGGGGIYAFAYDDGRVSLHNNTVRNNYSDRKAGGIFAYAVEVIGNTVAGNRAEKYGGGIFAINAVLKDNIVTDNNAPHGGGVYSENSQLIHSLVQGNTAEEGAGLYHLGDGLIHQSTFTQNAGPRPETGTAIALSGNPILSENNIIAPAGFALRLLSHSLSPDLKADDNFWGTTDKTVIEALVSDWLEDSQVGLVSWDNYRSAPVEKAYPARDPADLITGVTAPPLAPDCIRGVVEADTTLGAGETRRFTVTGNLMVQKGIGLNIAAGTELFLQPGATIRVRGQLTALGGKNNPIRFTGDPQQPWGLLFFENRSLDAQAQAAAAETKNTLNYCIIENGGGLLMDGYGADLTDCVIAKQKGTGIRIKESAASINRCRIQDNVSDTDGGGLYVYGSRMVYVHDNIISGNTAADGGGIFAYGYLSNVAVDIRGNRIENNTSLGDGGGVWVSRGAVVDNTISNNRADSKGGGVYAAFALVHNNRVNKNNAEEGGGIYADANSSLIDNTISDNAARGSGGGGVVLNFWGLSLHNKLFSGNTVEGNAASGDKNTGGVVMNGEMTLAGNIITGNSGYQLFNKNPADTPNTAAADCFWGTTDTGRIEALIYDGRDDPVLSMIDYHPPARTRAEALAKKVEDTEETERLRHAAQQSS